MNLKLKILIQLGAVMTSIFVIYTWLVVRSYRTDYLEAVKFRSSALASLIKMKAEEQISSPGGDVGGLGILTLDLKRIVDNNENVTHAFIFTPNGRIISHNNISMVDTPVSKLLIDYVRSSSHDSIIKDNDSYDTFVPIFHGQTPVAYVTIGFPAKIIEGKTWAILWKFFLLLVLSLAVSYSAGTLFVLREISGPLSNLNIVSSQIAGGNLTLSAEERKDEFGILSRSFNNMTQSLRGILIKIKMVAIKLTNVSRLMFQQSQQVQKGSSDQSSSLQAALRSVEALDTSVEEITHMIDNLMGLTHETSSSILEMTATVQEVEASASHLKESGESISTSITEMASSLKEVAHNVDTLTENADDTSSSVSQINVSIKQVEQNTIETAQISQEVTKEAEEGMISVKKTGEGITHIKKSVQDTATVINRLGQHSIQIGEILTVIGQVVDQTNLLALNAAIIATQAGEFGKGFSVVAQEIRNLAERTATSTQDIAKVIEAVQTDTAKAVSSVEAGLRMVEEGEKLSERSAHALERISESSKKALSMIEQITQATREQSKGSVRVAEASERISHSVHEIARATKEQTSGLDLIQQSSENLKHLSLQLHKATMEQAKGSRQISAVAEEVNTSITKISEATHKYREEYREIVKNIKKNLTLVDENLDAVKKMMAVVDDLVEQASVFSEEVNRFSL